MSAKDLCISLLLSNHSCLALWQSLTAFCVKTWVPHGSLLRHRFLGFSWRVHLVKSSAHSALPKVNRLWCHTLSHSSWPNSFVTRRLSYTWGEFKWGGGECAVVAAIVGHLQNSRLIPLSARWLVVMLWQCYFKKAMKGSNWVSFHC